LSESENPSTAGTSSPKVDNVKKKRKPRKVELPRSIDYEDAERIISGPNIRYITGLRNRLVLELMLRCGFRVSEICNLKIHHLNRKTWEIKVKEGKTGDRNLWVPREMEGLMLVWLDRRTRELPKSDWLFPTTRGTQLNRKYVYGMIQRMCKRAGVRDTHPHALRHTFAHRFLQKGEAIATLQLALGHSTPQMSLRYARAVAPDVRHALRGD